MFASTHGNRRPLCVATFVVTIALMACMCTPALSEEANEPTDQPQAAEQAQPAEQALPVEQVQQAYTELSALSEVAEQSTYDVISIRAQLDDTQHSIDDLDVQIQQGEEELQRVRNDLSQFIAGDYKQGQQSLLDIMLSSSDFEQFITRVIYANKVVERERSAIEQVIALMEQQSQHKREMQQKKETLENMLEEQVVREEAADVATADVQQFIEQMPEEMFVQVMAYEQSVREENAEQSREILQQIEQMAAESQAAQNNNGGASSDSGQSSESSQSDNGGNTANSANSGNTGNTASAGSNQNESSSGSSYSGGSSSDASSSSDSSQSYSGGTSSSSSAGSTSSSSSSYSSDFMTRLYSIVGSGYQWSGYNYTGSTSDSSFTCSGVVDYALGRDSRSSSPETLYGEVGNNLTTDVSSFQEGDLVFYSYGGRDVGHVAVYVGDGKVIDSIPDGGVAVRDVDYMDVVGGGSMG